MLERICSALEYLKTCKGKLQNGQANVLVDCATYCPPLTEVLNGV